MTLAFPNPLFPLLAASIAGADKLGWYYSSIAVGALIATLTSRWTLFKKHHGQMITLSASLWGVCIVLFGLSLNFFYLSLLFLMAAGFFDMVSGIFRSTMWNETIPHDKRGRLASVEMLSYASGPLIGSTLMGWMADVWSASQALMIGGVSCFIICLLGGWSLREFWHYEAQA
jgi:MFS family permease